MKVLAGWGVNWESHGEEVDFVEVLEVSEYSEFSEYSERPELSEMPVVSERPGMSELSEFSEEGLTSVLGTIGFSLNRFFMIGYLLGLREILGWWKKGTLTKGESFGRADRNGG